MYIMIILIRVMIVQKSMQQLLREKLGFDVNLGIEIGLQPNIDDKIARIATSLGLDYVVASTNIVEGQEVNKYNYFEGKDKESIYRKYFEHEFRNVKELNKYFDAYTNSVVRRIDERIIQRTSLI